MTGPASEGALPDLIEVADGDTRWRFETAFLQSRWQCIWGRGCLGILDEPAEHLGQGCCSIGAELADEDEAMTIGALAATLEPELFQHHADAAAGGIYADDRRNATRIVDGACIFFNHPGFGGGAGCALHLAATAAGEEPLDWKPSVCWQLPIRVDWEAHEDGTETATMRRWSRADWGADGETMAWCCTEGDRAYVGDTEVIDSLGEEIEALVGTEVLIALRRELGGRRLA